MHFDDDRWADLKGGYREPYDPRPALKRLQAGDDDVWDELWQELYHQGDVGEASYAAVPHIVRLCNNRADWNAYALVATIEEARLQDHNPPLPEWQKTSYEAAWQALFEHALRDLPAATDETLIDSILAVLAIHKGRTEIARLLGLTEVERAEILDTLGYA